MSVKRKNRFKESEKIRTMFQLTWHQRSREKNLLSDKINEKRKQHCLLSISTQGQYSRAMREKFKHNFLPKITFSEPQNRISCKKKSENFDGPSARTRVLRREKSVQKVTEASRRLLSRTLGNDHHSILQNNNAQDYNG